jgi:hypothetical protein
MPNAFVDLGEEILQGTDPAFYGRSRKSLQRRTRDPRQYPPHCSPELNPQENLWDEIRDEILPVAPFETLGGQYGSLAIETQMNYNV